MRLYHAVHGHLNDRRWSLDSDERRPLTD
uniref:Uncharacterized protein n=1 Tax=Anguilla anguilla TaxID=7936 RepID=A0A0E9PJ33_ANGAN